MHTVEHILNQTMVRMFGCGRSHNAHIERKKGRCDYEISSTLTPEQIIAIEQQVNSVVEQALDVKCRLVTRAEAAQLVDLSRLPEDASSTIRLVSVGNYDHCACVGEHVKNTAEIGIFFITSYSQENGILRLRFKLKPVEQ